MKTAVVAVLDVGKTNKKVSVYDSSFQILASERTVLGTTLFDGLEVERTEDMLAWFKGALAKLSADYDIRAISICTQGATCALLDETGALAYPVISYTSEKGSEVTDEFYATYGAREVLHKATSSCDLGFANLAKVFFYVKHRMPAVWARVRHAVFLPQYLGYELTGNLAMEPTYVGNHSYLWDLEASTWSAVGKGLGVDAFFPAKLSASWDCLGPVKADIAKACGLSDNCMVTMGIHDSNANFLPYLAKGYQNCTLNSTGTWCVAMQSGESRRLTDDEIAHRIFFNLDAYNRPVKTVVFPGGLEYETFSGFTSLKDENDPAALADVIRAKELFIITGVLPDATIFPGTVACVVQDGKGFLLKDLKKDTGKPMTALGPQYLAALNLSLAIQSAEVFKRLGAQAGAPIFIEGGFAKNRQYCELLAALCPASRIVLTSLPEGTSMGAAILGWMLLDGQTAEAVGERFSIETREVQPVACEGLDAYLEAYRRQLV